jgi:metal-dependent amidase/aminoacylase/carboxypeptidase family protein
MSTSELFASLHAEMTAWRQDIKARPAVGLQEDRTAGLVAAKLEAFGFDKVHRGVGRTSVVGVLRAGLWNERDQFAQVIKDAAIKLD